MIEVPRPGASNKVASQRELLKSLDQSEELCQGLYQALSSTLKAFQSVLNNGDDMDTLLEEANVDLEDPLQVFSYFSRNFVEKLKRVKTLVLNVADSLPEDELNLKPSRAFDIFLDGAIDHMLGEQADIILQELQEPPVRPNHH